MIWDIVAIFIAVGILGYHLDKKLDSIGGDVTSIRARLGDYRD